MYRHVCLCVCTHATSIKLIFYPSLCDARRDEMPLCKGTLEPELVKFVHCVIFILMILSHKG